MKKSIIITIVILALLATMLPLTTVFAADKNPQTKVTIINRTKGTVNMHLIGPSGLHYSYSFPNALTNLYTIEVPQGQYYSYYIQSHCETIIGTWNMSRNRLLNLYCPHEEGLLANFRAPAGLTPK